MDRRKTILTIVITLFIVVAVVAAGYAVYRLGFVQGSRSSARIMPGGMFHDFEGRLPQDFDGRFLQGMHPGGAFRYSQHMPMGNGAWFGFFPGLLLLTGVFALVVLAINSFGRPNREAALPQPPIKEEKSGKPAENN